MLPLAAYANLPRISGPYPLKSFSAYYFTTWVVSLSCPGPITYEWGAGREGGAPAAERYRGQRHGYVPCLYFKNELNVLDVVFAIRDMGMFPLTTEQ